MEGSGWLVADDDEKVRKEAALVVWFEVQSGGVGLEVGR